MAASLLRYWRTLRHLRGEQLRYLVVRRILRLPRAVQAPTVRARDGACLPTLAALSEPAIDEAGSLTFVGVSASTRPRIDWIAADRSRLWRYNLHYFDWCRQPELGNATILAHVRDWIEHNPPFRGTGWEPYPTALRVVNWLARLTPDARAGEIDDSLALQAAWLERNLEFQLGANHLFVDIKALLFAGVAFTGNDGERWLERAQDLMRRELDDQFLADGGHYERSPMYHALLTVDLLELLALDAANPGVLDTALIARIRAAAVAALRFASATHLPDNGPAFFNDSALGIAPTLDVIERFARELGLELSPFNSSQGELFGASGYWAVRRGNHMLVADCGDIGPPHQPGHGHCDLLSFELALDGRRRLVNCGNFDYESGKRRSFARSTRSHNTVTVDGQEQSEVWSVFRVGRRARPDAVTSGSTAGRCWLDAAHDGYECLPGGPRHRRRISVDDRFTVHVRDEVDGAGEHVVVAWLHFEPSLAVEYSDGGFVVLRDGAECLRIEIATGIEATIETTPRYPRFGVATSGASVALRTAGELPRVIDYRIIVARHGHA